MREAQSGKQVPSQYGVGVVVVEVVFVMTVKSGQMPPHGRGGCQ